MKEIWKDIEGYEGRYQVSNFGRVKSLARIVSSCYGSSRTVSERMLRPSTTHGYKTVILSLGGSIQGRRVHRLVAQSFIPNPENKGDVNHRNGVRSDNRVDNLEWCTPSENMRHSFRVLGKIPNKTMLGRLGKYSPTSKPVSQFTKSGEFVAEYSGAAEASRVTSVNAGHISACCTGKRKSAGRFVWMKK